MNPNRSTQTVEFSRTKQAAVAERSTKWDLIAAIADDAVENELPITGAQSQVAAKQAMEQAGTEYADRTVKELCIVAKFDHESNPAQQKVWRTYGWTIIRPFADQGWSQEAAAVYLGESRRSKREVTALVHPGVPGNHPEPSIDDAWREWLNRCNRLLLDGAKLADRSERDAAELGAYSAAAQLIYSRITERRLDAELRELLESVESEA